MLRIKIQSFRTCIAALLFVMLTYVFFVTTLHHHQEISRSEICVECDIRHHNIHRNHISATDNDSSSNCVICHFAFSIVEKASFQEFNFYKNYERIAFVNPIRSIDKITICYYSLRAPPVSLS